MKRHFSRTIIVTGTAIVALTACVYRMDIPQGNRIDISTVEQLEIGMSRSQVEFLMGSPAIVDSYQPNQWHYVYFSKDGSSGKIEKSTMMLQFSGDLLQSIEGDLTPG